jgi:hypothetical protein
MAKHQTTAETAAPPPPVAAEPANQGTALQTAAGNGQVDRPLSELFMEDAGGGLQNLGANDFAVPFLTILQKGSPQVSRANSKFIKGAEAGMIMNTVTGALYPGEEGIPVVPCAYNKLAVRWKNRDDGGGLVCSYKETDPILKTFKVDPRGRMFDEATRDIVVDTAYHFILHVHDEGFPEYGIISMYSTQLKASRTWNTTMRTIMKKDAQGRAYNPPSYSHVYRLTTVGQTKDSYDWFGWRIVSEGEVQSVDLYKMAKAFSVDAVAGRIRVSAPPQDFEEAPTDKEEVPF